MIPAVVLAAGKSSRMGLIKATLPIGRRDTFLTRIIRTFYDASVDDVIVVVGHEADTVEKSVATSGLAPRFVLNADYEAGQLSSLLAGLRAVDRPGVSAMLFTLVDTPLISVPIIRAVLDRYRTTRAPVVRPVQGIRHGHPVLVDRSLFAALLAADPVQGAKPVIHEHVSLEGEVETVDEGAFTDVDTPEDYARMLAGLGARP